MAASSATGKSTRAAGASCDRSNKADRAVQGAVRRDRFDRLRLALFALRRLHLLLPQIPDPVDDREVDRVGFSSFLGAEIGDLAAEANRPGFQPRVDIGVVGSEHRTLDVGTDGDIAVSAHQYDRVAGKRPRQRLADT